MESILFEMPVSHLKYYSLYLLLLPLEIPAQTGTDISPAVKDTSKTDITTHSFYSGAGYGSNMVYLGSTISQNQPYGYGSLTYGFKNQLYASVSAVHLSGLNPFLSFYIGSLNYSHVFNNWFDISAGVSRYQVVPSLTDTLFNSFTYGDITLGFDWKLLYSKISVGGLFSNRKPGLFSIQKFKVFPDSRIV